MRNVTLSLCIIVKNEEKFIAKCLNAVKDIIDEIIIVDTGSTDSTLDIINEYDVKLYKYTWNNDFSATRNYAINKATGDWILFLDADEILDLSSQDKILKFIKTTNFDGCHFLVHNYTAQDSTDYTIHYALRLFKNNKGYYYKGKIHEQIANKDESVISNNFSNENILLHHYGYSQEVLKDKDKRLRNIPILLDMLKENPNDSFTLFNLGNEYLAKNDIVKALEYYDLSYRNINMTQHYAIHLYYRIAVCYQNIKDYAKAIKFVNEALQYYSPNVDFEFLRGCLYYDQENYTLAIDSFNKCLELGDDKSSVKFINNCGTINPLISLGDLHFKLKDYHKALDFYNKALNLNNTNTIILYKIGSTLNKIFTNKNYVKNSLLDYFASKTHTPNIIFTLDILIKENLFLEAESLIIEHGDFKDYLVDYNYINGIINFYNKKYNDALHCFNNVFIEKDLSLDSNIILKHSIIESTIYLFALSILTNTNSLSHSLENIKKYCDSITYSTFKEIYNIVTINKANIISSNTEIVMNILENFLSKFLKIREFDVFQTLIEIYNFIEDKSILVSLAKIYNENGFKEMAKANVIMSIKKFDYIDKSCKEIIFN